MFLKTQSLYLTAISLRFRTKSGALCFSLVGESFCVNGFFDLSFSFFGVWVTIGFLDWFL